MLDKIPSHLDFTIVCKETEAIRSRPSQTGPVSQCVLYVKAVPNCVAKCRQSQTVVESEVNFCP